MAVIQEIKLLTEDREAFTMQLKKNRKIHIGERMNCRERLTALRKEEKDAEKKIAGLVDSLAGLGDSAAKVHVVKRMEQLNQEWMELKGHICELERLSSQNELSHTEFEGMCQILAGFADGIDEMSIQQKRMVIHSIVRKVVWDGLNAHVVLFGAQDDEFAFPDTSSDGSETELKTH